MLCITLYMYFLVVCLFVVVVVVLFACLFLSFLFCIVNYVYVRRIHLSLADSE